MSPRLPSVAAISALLLTACSGNGAADDANLAPARPSAIDEAFALTSQSITLPTDENEMFPPGPHVDAVNDNCRACHSPSMVLTQPPLTHEEWAAAVQKMRQTYKAAIDDADVPGILVYLDAFSTKQIGARPPADAIP